MIIVGGEVRDPGGLDDGGDPGRGALGIGVSLGDRQHGDGAGPPVRQRARVVHGARGLRTWAQTTADRVLWAETAAAGAVNISIYTSSDGNVIVVLQPAGCRRVTHKRQRKEGSWCYARG